MEHPYLQIHPKDNVVAALKKLSIGHLVRVRDKVFPLVETIPAKHKFTTTELAIGDAIYMYGVLVGKASQSIKKGGLISTENIVHAAQSYSEQQTISIWEAPDVRKWANKTFAGYHRSNGRVRVFCPE